MNAGEPFYARRRLKELRALIRSTIDFDDPGDVEDAMTSLLFDLADDLASRADGGREDAYHFIIRCMGAVAEAEAGEAYAPHGFHNPFGPAASAPAEPPLKPAMPMWTWPILHQPPRTGSGGFAGATMREYSALKMFGYTVGKTEGWPQHKREAFLRDFMAMPLPPIVKATFGDEYGAPLTTTRLRKIANVIASNATNFFRNDATRYAVAIAEWEEDLDFLYRVFYIGMRLGFEPWPSTRPA